MTGMTNQNNGMRPVAEIVPEPYSPEQLQTPSRSRRIDDDRRPWYRQLRWGDFLMYGLITIIAVGLLLAAPLGVAGQTQVAVLTEEGRLLFSKPLTELQQAGSFTVEALGYHYVIAFESGRIRFSEADCPDKVCVRTGWVSRAGQVAACVPGHLILKITGPSTSGIDDIDIVLQ